MRRGAGFRPVTFWGTPSPPASGLVLVELPIEADDIDLDLVPSLSEQDIEKARGLDGQPSGQFAPSASRVAVSRRRFGVSDRGAP